MFTTLNIYSHITDTMQQQAAARIDREIAGADTPIPEPAAIIHASITMHCGRDFYAPHRKASTTAIASIPSMFACSKAIQTFPPLFRKRAGGM